MVVLQLGPYPPPHGGVQTNLVAIRDHLRRHRIPAPVINLTRYRRPESDEVYYPKSALEVLKLLVTTRADVIHLHIGGNLTFRLLSLCLICSLIPGRRTVLTFHSGGYPSSTRGARRASLRGCILRRVDAIIAVNPEIAAWFRRLGVPASRIELICPYAPVFVRDHAGVPEEIRRFMSTHAPLLTTVGLLEPEYDLSLQMRALPIVRRTFPDAGLIIIGSGSLESELRRSIAASADSSHILLCGDVPHPVTVRVISQSDVFVRTTRYDGDSVSIREALQLGVHVVATDNGMRPAGVCLLPRPDETSLSELIGTVLRELRGRTGSAAAPTSQMDEVLRLYSRLLDRAPSVDARRFCNRYSKS